MLKDFISFSEHSEAKAQEEEDKSAARQLAKRIGVCTLSIFSFLA